MRWCRPHTVDRHIVLFYFSSISLARVRYCYRRSVRPSVRSSITFMYRGHVNCILLESKSSLLVAPILLSVNISILAQNRDYTWLSVIRQRVEFKLCVLVFNSLHNQAPNYLSTPPCVNWSPRTPAVGTCVQLRVAIDLAVPVTRTTRYGPGSFAVAGPST